MSNEKKDNVIQIEDYKYLIDTDAAPNSDHQEMLSVPAEFSALRYGHPGAIEVGGKAVQGNKFSAEGFPEQELEEIYLIPLYLNPNARSMYLDIYSSGEAKPPDCRSQNGVTPLKPLELNGVQITRCGDCPLFGYGRGFKCRTKPTLIGLAYFPDYNDLLVPVRKEIPGTSAKNFNSMARQLTMSVLLGITAVNIPYYKRIIRLTPEFITAKNVWGWNFEVLNAQSQYGVPNFVPEHLIPEVEKFLGIARSFVQIPQIAPALTGESKLAQLPVQSSATVLAQEEASAF